MTGPAQIPLPPSALSPGDTLPFAYGMDEVQRYWSFEDQAGRASVLILAGDAPPSDLAALSQAFGARADKIALLGARVRLLAQVGAPGWATAEPPAGVALAHLMDARLLEAAGGAPCVLVADRALRLLGRLDARHPDAAVGAVLGLLAAATEAPARQVRTPAPVLITPHVFDPDLCGRLIAAFEGGDHGVGAMASIDGEGRLINRIDAAKKHRRDLTLDPAGPLHGEVEAALSARLVPQIAKAFQVRVAHLDRILIARYDDTGGYFRRHRDNSSAHLAYREFALSVNLNTGDYEGGELLFPEFNDDRHNPPVGGALVFSASLLHEAAAVTRGRRYVLLSFLHSDDAEARRVATLAQASAVDGLTTPA